MRFLHTGDWQIGMPARFLSDEARARYAAARLDAIRRIGQIAAAQNCSFVLVVGDVFDANRLTAQTIGRALEAMADVPVPLYLLPGNHDCLEAGSIYASQAFAKRRDHIRVLDSTGVHQVEGGEILAVPWASKRPGRDLIAEALTAVDPAPDGVVRILAGHGQLDTYDPDPLRTERIATAPLKAALTDGRIHFAALGDRHILTNAKIDGRVWYAGTPEPTFYDEKKPGFCLVVDVDADGPARVDSHKVATWTFMDLEVKVNSHEDVARLEATLDQIPAKENTAVRLSPSGTLSLAAKAEYDLVLAEARHVFGGLEVWERHNNVAVLTDAGDMAALHLTGYAASAAEQLKADAAAGGDPGRAATYALALLYRLAASA